MTTFEEMVTALINGETVDIAPRSNMEEYLLACINESGTEGLPTPRSRADVLLQALAQKWAEDVDAKPEQEKTLTLTTSGTEEVTPDAGYALSKVTVEVDIPAAEEASF